MEAEITPEEFVGSVRDSAERFETPCGVGTIVWRKWGRGRPLLFLHGAHGAWSHWIRNIPYFARSRAVWAPDLPGYGDSAMPTDPTTGDGVVAALVEGMRSLFAAEAPIDVVGFSFGGVMATHVAALAPALVNRLILVDTGGLGTPSGKRPMTSIKNAATPADLNAAHRANLRMMMINQDRNIDDLAVYIQATNAPRGRLDPRSLVMPDRMLHSLPRSSTRVDAIWGEFDGPHPDPAVQCEALRRLRPQAQFRIIPGVGHWAMFEGADAFNAVLDDLLNTDGEVQPGPDQMVGQ